MKPLIDRTSEPTPACVNRVQAILVLAEGCGLTLSDARNRVTKAFGRHTEQISCSRFGRLIREIYQERRKHET